MKLTLKTIILIVTALITVLATLLHASIADISIFHGMILHPVFLLIGFSLLAIIEEQGSRD
ncbi:hypothetical protein [Pseudoalteromonas denitrificans]|jgi:hypothetical protein|uniref:Uncharacterized protein n=1 Tax=Pseudoalteromonas denitrificans DSM 6059 TaxID=1123010 RepID=A0A1I1I4I6_9GAMM|nr:hypothetical protein [Pseudoalteromonas denitrificans]SFC30955.1 hypothetical protein SAMN02745724_01368 [Pseudoalteromonas denitrificans DSM 6059]